MSVARSILFGLSVLAMGCGGDTAAPTNNNGGTGPGGGTGSTATDIDVNDNNFDPSATTVPINSTITWTWAGAAPHNVTFSTAGITGSGDKTTGTFQKGFPNAGVFNYSCTNHGGMTGKITVQ